MGRTYTGVGYLTGRRLTIQPGRPRVVVDDDTKRIPDRKGGKGLMTNISEIRARQVLDSRGNPTVEAEVQVRGGGVA